MPRKIKLKRASAAAKSPKVNKVVVEHSEDEIQNPEDDVTEEPEGYHDAKEPEDEHSEDDIQNPEDDVTEEPEGYHDAKEPEDEVAENHDYVSAGEELDNEPSQAALKESNGIKENDKKKKSNKVKNEDETDKKKKKKKKPREDFEVAQIIDMEINSRWHCPIRFLVRWVGFTEQDDSWSSVANLECDDIVQDFLQISGRKPEYQKAFDKFMEGTKFDPQFESKSLRAKGIKTSYVESDQDDDEMFFKTSTRTRQTKMPNHYNPSEARPQLKKRQPATAAPKKGISRQQADINQAGREYEVEMVVDHRKRGRFTEYKVSWKGLASNEDSWVKEDDLNCTKLVKNFLSRIEIKDDTSEDDDENEVEYEVASIIDSKETGGKVLYKVRWKGFSAKHDSWMPANEMNCPELVTKFEAALSKLKKKQDWVVEKILSRRETSSGRVEYLVHWYGFEDNSDTWEPEDNLSNCQDKLDDFIAKEQAKNIKKNTENDYPTTAGKRKRGATAKKSKNSSVNKRNKGNVSNSESDEELAAAPRSKKRNSSVNKRNKANVSNSQSDEELAAAPRSNKRNSSRNAKNVSYAEVIEDSNGE